MVLHHVANASSFVVKFAAALHPESLCHGDLHAVNIVAIPDGLQKRIREPEEHQIFNSLFAQIGVDAEDRRLREDRMENLIQFLSRYEVTPKRLLKNHARVPRTPRLVESLDYRGEHAGRNCDIVGRVLRLAERLEQLIRSE